MLNAMTKTGTNITLTNDTLQQLYDTFQGVIIQPEDAAYDAARAVWNGMIDKHPALIAQCTGTADVVAAVNFARENDLLVAVRGGGHNVAGTAVCDGGIVIDLSPMKGIHVDANARVARAQGGVTWGELDRETQLHGLATPGGVVSMTGIAGLTLGGGLGWLRNKFGLSCDNLIGAEVVTASGEVIHATEENHADLLWGLRGGGGNFGIVTNFEYQLHAVGPELMMTFVLHPGEDTAKALRFYRDYVADAPDEVSSFAICGQVPPEEPFPEAIHGRRYVMFAACYTGNIDDGKRVTQPLRDYDTPLIDFSEPMPYMTIQSLLDEDYPEGELHYYWKSLYLDDLSDDAIDMIDIFADQAPSNLSTVDVWHVGGAVQHVADDATAFSPRQPSFLLGVEANWEPHDDDDANIAWTRECIEKMQVFSDGSQYLNFPGFHEEGDEVLQTTFGGNYQRLVKLKTKYDPTNLFRRNSNIEPQPS